MRPTSFQFHLFALIIISTLISGSAQAQGQIVENFEDGELLNNPFWGGQRDSFIVFQDGANRLLQLNAKGTNVFSYLQTASAATFGIWEGLVRMDFNPSSSNYMRVYLMADQPDLTGSLNGYFLDFGRSNDEISLYRQNGTTITEIIDGTDNTLNTTTVLVRYRVSRSQTGQFTLWADLTGGSNFIEIGSASDNGAVNAQVAGMLFRYTSTRNKAFFVDDFAWPDPPFRVTGAEAVTRTRLQVFFSRAVDAQTAQASRFTINGNRAASQSETDGATVTLTFDPSMPGGALTLTVSDQVLSAGGLTLEAGFREISFQLIDEPSAGEISITEVLFDPPTGLSDYVELLNTTQDHYFSLQQLKIADAAGTATVISEKLLAPGEFVVLSGDTAGLFSGFGHRNYVKVTGFPSFNGTTPDAVVLIGESLLRLDSLTYATNWGTAKKSIERRSVSIRATARSNWGASPADVGSPGVANTIDSDNIPPSVQSAVLLNANTLQLKFSEEINAQTATSASSFSATGGVTTGQPGFSAPDTIRIPLSGVVSGVPFQVNIGGITDLFGNALNTSIALEWLVIANADSGKIVLNEIMYDPFTGAQDYIELWNRSDENLALKDLLVADATQTFRPITTGSRVLRAGQYAVIARDSALLNVFPGIPLVAMGSGFPSLNNTGQESIILRSAAALLDSVTWNASVWGGAKIALERRSPEVAAVFQNNWLPSLHPDKGTPGAGNSVRPDSTTPYIIRVEIVDNLTIDLFFNEDLDPATAGSAAGVFSGNIDINFFTVQDAQIVRMNLLQSLQNNTTYSFSVEGFTDLFGNPVRLQNNIFTYYDVGSALPGDVVVTEFMYDPPAGFSEFIELRNNRAVALDLKDWTLNDQGGSRRSIVKNRYLLPPGGLVVLAPDSTIQDMFPGVEMITLGSGFPSLNNSTDYMVLRGSGGLLIDSVSYNTTWGGDGVSLERILFSGYSSISDNWGDSPAPLGGTPGTTNQIPAPSTPTRLVSAAISHPDSILFNFDRTVQTGDNFAVNFTPSIGIRSFGTAGRQLYIIPTNSISNRTTLDIRVAGMQDIFGNTSAPVSSILTYYEYSRAAKGEIHITEFMFDPPDGLAEYVEIEYTGTGVVNLQKLRISDNSSSFRAITGTPVAFLPGTRLVVTADSALVKRFPDRQIYVVSGLPSFANTADAIVVKNDSGQTLDSLFYTASWGGVEVSLERRSLQLAATVQANWGPSPEETGGTPGLANAVLPDLDRPSVLAADPWAGDSLRVRFSESLPEVQTSINPFVEIASAGVVSTGVRISGLDAFFSLSGPIPAGGALQIRLRGISDWFGNVMRDTTLAIANQSYPQPAAGALVINEIQFRGSDVYPEYVEIWNTGRQPVDLSGWIFSDEANTVVLKAPLAKTANGFSIPVQPDSFLVLTGNAVYASTISNGFYMAGFPGLGNTGEPLIIRTPDGVLSDSVFYREFWLSAPSGVPLERKDNLRNSNDPLNWAAGAAGGTPGKINSRFEPDIIAPEVLFATVRDNTIEVEFSEFVLLEPDAIALNGTQVSFTMHPATLSKAVLSLPVQVNPSSESEIVITAVEDYRANRSTSLRLPLAWPSRAGLLKINEIMHNPIADPRDGRPDQSEYVELINAGAATVSLEGMRLQTPVDERGQFSVVSVSGTVRSKLAPGGYAVIHADTSGLFSNTRIARFFDISDEKSFYLSDRTTLGFGSTSGTVILADSTGTILDSVMYSSEWHNPNLLDTRGRSLERILASGSSNLSLNWGTTTELAGGTPGKQNSIQRNSTSLPGKMGVSIFPDPFSPDGDGFEDHAQIRWEFAEAGNLLRIRVFDRYGRLVRNLADQIATGFEGSVFWDGNGDDRKTVRAGIYIIIVETTVAGKKGQAFKKTVVLAPGR